MVLIEAPDTADTATIKALLDKLINVGLSDAADTLDEDYEWR